MLKIAKKTPFLFLICSLTVFANPTISTTNNVCEIWSVTMHHGGVTETGKWNFNNGSDPGRMTGNGTSQDGNKVYTYDLTADIDTSGGVTVQRTNSSDGNVCTYSGIKTGNSITDGTYICINSPDVMQWGALISTCSAKTKRLSK